MVGQFFKQLFLIFDLAVISRKKQAGEFSCADSSFTFQVCVGGQLRLEVELSVKNILTRLIQGLKSENSTVYQWEPAL